jgi:RNA 2',3'-cyclic 3'-phosphodiesterase
MNPLISKLFVAIPAPEAVAEALRQLRQLNAGLSGVRWVPEENLHITVFFLGFVDALHIPAIKVAMHECLADKPAFTLFLEGITLEGGRPKHPSMVWARFKKNEKFTKLAGELGQRLLPYLSAPSKFPDPIPHITLARIKHEPLPDVAVNVTCEIEFKGYELWRSVSVQGGVKYEKL